MTSTRYCKKALIVRVEKERDIMNWDKSGEGCRGLNTQGLHVSYIKQFFIPTKQWKAIK